MCRRPDHISQKVEKTMKIAFIKSAYALAIAGAVLSGSVLVMTTDARAQAATAAKSPVNLSSDVKIERTELDAAGKEKTVLREPKDVVIVPGDRVLFTLSVSNSGSEPASGFRAVNPIPGAVTFIAVAEDWAEVSVDNGISWGKLSAMSVKAKAADTGVETARAAVAEDVTHVRWVFADVIAPGAKNSVSYRGVVK
jgi:uncharacterized repeat protein (TIGR01451 family)